MSFTRARAVAAIGAGFALPLLPSRTWAAGPTSLNVAAASDDDITPILYGVKSGIFAKNGLNVNVTTLGSGSATAAAVQGRSIDIGKSSLPALIAAHTRGIDFQILASGSIYRDRSPIAGFVVANDSGVKGPKDLNGKVVAASSLKDLIAIATQAWIDENGGDSKSVQFIELPSSAVAAALEQHRIVGATMITPALAIAVDTGKAHVLAKSFSAIAKRFLVAGWFATKERIASDPDTMKRFIAAFREASAYTDDHHAETVQLLADFSHIKPSTIRGMVRSYAGGGVDPRDIEPVIAACVKYGVIDKGFPAGDIIASVASR